MSLKYALIGCGRISFNHVAAAIKNGLDIVALCDIVPQKAEELAAEFGLSGKVKIVSDYRELFNDKPDLVAIATQSGNRGQIALDCIEQGIHLIIEKPITLSLHEADEIIKRSKEKGVKVCACHQNRFNKSVQKLREAVEQGRFGKLLHGTAHIRWNRSKEYYEQAPWRGTWELDGGALMNQGIHNIDLLRWIMGSDIVEVYGVTDNKEHSYIEAEDIGLAIVKFANGSLGLIEGTTYVYPKNLEETLYIFGQKGTVKLGGKSVNIIEEWHFADGLDDPEKVKEKFHENPPNVYGYGHDPLYKDVMDAIKNDRKPYIDAVEGRKALELVLAIYKSSIDGNKVKLPLDGVSSIDFKGMFNK
ncbi:MAG: Gfo/Idh/MocA family oxidoreductase [Bacillota bacterium]|nr:Gfo/Idh/MocA family oxidoreductase [Bacillota bacterium]